MRDLTIKNGISSRIYHQRIRAGWMEVKAATQPINKRYTGDYAVYRKGELVLMGSRKECADFLGVREDYIRWMTTPNGIKRRSKRRNPEKAMAAVKLDEDEQ